MKKSVFATIILLAILSIGIYYYHQRFADNIKKTGYLFVPTGATFQQVKDNLSPFLNNRNTFEQAAKKLNLDKKIHSGRYSLKPGMSNTEIINKIKEGKQDEIAIRIGNYASIMELAGRIAPFLECDSAQILQGIMNASYNNGLDTPAMLYYFIPNTYNFHWNTSGEQFAKQMKNEFDKFWNTSRKDKARQSDMTLLQITTLASIVQLEAAKEDEQEKVAGLYLNRLKVGMKLDADPTIIFIKKMQNGFKEKVSRVYYKDLQIPSPYNTYRNVGLPPSPICMPNPSAIDAVLNPVKHDYFYFVADTKKPGYHIFSKTLAEQEANAAIYRKWLDENQIN